MSNSFRKQRNNNLSKRKTPFTYISQFLAFIIIFAQVLVLPKVFAATLADPADIFTVTSPSPNSVIEGVRDVSFIMYDDDATSIPFTADLLNYPSCTQSFGAITATTSGISHSSVATTFSWNTNSTQSTASLSDGVYCLRICVQLLNDTQAYSACNSRVITLVNNNELPIITNSPSDFSLNENESWSFNLEASDSDGDLLSYSLVSAPSFVVLNGSRLIINSAPKLADDVSSLSYTVSFAVSDNLSGSVSKSFNITVINPDVVLENQEEEPIPSDSTAISFLKPEKDQVIFEDIFKVEWSISNSQENVTNIELEYSKDGLEWIKAQGDSTQSNSFDWNTVSVLDGAYYLRLNVLFGDENTLTQRSSRFIIEKSANTDFSSVPLIVNVKPQNNETQVSINSITGELVASKDAQIDTASFELVVDEEDVTQNCKLTEQSFECLFEESFSSGVHEAKASIMDSSGSSNEFSWQFKVGNPTEAFDGSTSEDSFTLFGRTISRSALYLLVLLCALTFIVLFVPWLLFAMWRRDDEGNTTDTFETTIYPTNDAFPQTTLTTNYYQPDSYQTSPATTYYEPTKIS